MFLSFLYLLFPILLLVPQIGEATDRELQACKTYFPEGQALATQLYNEWLKENPRYYAHSGVRRPWKDSVVIKEMTQLFKEQIQQGDKDEKFMPDWIQAQLPNLSRDFVETSKGRIHYLKGGTGKKILVFFHGNPTWSFIWRKIIANLDPTKYTFIAPDLMNLGFSDSLAKPQLLSIQNEQESFKMENVVTAMDEFLKVINQSYSLESNPDVTLIVQDWGGPIGFGTALRNPDFFKKIVILNTGVGIPQELPDFQKKSHSLLAPLSQRWAPSLFGFIHKLSKVQHDPNSISGIVDKAYQYPLYLSDNLDMTVHYARMVPSRDTDKKIALESIELFEENENFLRNFNGPIQVVWGVSDPVLGEELEKTVKKILPEQTLYKKVLAGHFLQEECPIEIAESIENIQE